MLQTCSLWFISQPNISTSSECAAGSFTCHQTPRNKRACFKTERFFCLEIVGPCLIWDLKVSMHILYVLWKSAKLKWVEDYNIVCLEFNYCVKWKAYVRTLCGGQVHACSALFWPDLEPCEHTPQCQSWANKQYWETGCQLHSLAFGQVSMGKLLVINLKNILHS